MYIYIYIHTYIHTYNIHTKNFVIRKVMKCEKWLDKHTIYSMYVYVYIYIYIKLCVCVCVLYLQIAVNC